jgi:hypothetical protein
MKSIIWQRNMGRRKFLEQGAGLVCSGLLPIAFQGKARGAPGKNNFNLKVASNPDPG